MGDDRNASSSSATLPHDVCREKQAWEGCAHEVSDLELTEDAVDGYITLVKKRVEQGALDANGAHNLFQELLARTTGALHTFLDLAIKVADKEMCPPVSVVSRLDEDDPDKLYGSDALGNER